MPSINLLPENYVSKTRDREESHKSYLYMVLSFLLIFISAGSSVGLYFYNQFSKEKIKFIDTEIKGIDEQLKKATEGNELLAAENKAKNIKYFLSEHVYLSEVYDFFQKNTLSAVYFKTLNVEFEKKVLNVKFEASTGDYLSSAIQIAIFKESPFVDDVSIENVSVDKEGKVSFSGTLLLKNELVFKRTVQFESSLSEINEAESSAKIKVVISSVSSSEISVDYAVTEGMATEEGITEEKGGESDYQLPLKGTIKIPSGETSANLSIPIADDKFKESDKMVVITLSNPKNAILGTNSVHTLKIAR